MNRTVVYLIAFLVLGISAIIFLTTKNDKTSLTDRASLFAIENTDEIGKIFLANRNKSATLTRQEGNKWLYEGKHLVRQQSIDILLKTMKDVRVRYVVAEAALDNVTSELAVKGIKVEIYDKKDKLMKVYYVGGVSTDGQGTNMIMADSDQPYVTHIPVWEGVLTPRFMLEEADWRDRTVFKEQPDDIQFVSVEYPRQRRFSFNLERKNNKDFEVTPFYITTPTINRPLNPSSVQKYLIGFKRIIAEAFENDNPNKANVLENETPFAIITLKKKNGSTKKATLYSIDESFDGSGTSQTPFVNNTIERYFVLKETDKGSDFMLGQHRVFRELFRGYEFFFEETVKN